MNLKKLKLQVSKAKFNTLSEAYEILKLSAGNFDFFYDELERRGWKDRGEETKLFGSYKYCFVKDTIVVKFPKSELNKFCTQEIKREYEQYTQATQSFQRHLPKIYGLVKGVLFQDFVPKACQVEKCALLKIKKRFPLKDADHNHAHSKRGAIKFFDWVYNRFDRYIYNEDLPLYKNKKEVR